MIRVAVIGVGYWGPNLLRNFNAIPDCRVTWVCDRDPKRLRSVCQGFPNVRPTTDADEVFNSDVDAVVIATPALSHFSLAKRALESGLHAFVETGAVIGDNVTLKNHVCVWEGVLIEDDVFIGPGVLFTNDRYPRSPRMGHARRRYADKANWLANTRVERGCSVGAGATIVAGVTLGRYCLIAAGAIVTKDVEPHALMVGAPAKKRGSVCRCGGTLNADEASRPCPACGHLLDTTSTKPHQGETNNANTVA